MVLQSSGAISLNDIQNEFGGTNPIGIDEYYSSASGIPSSGTISLDQFYGASAETWEIIMHTDGYKGSGNNLGDTTAFGNTGTNTFKTITSSSTGANNRTAFGDGVGLYNAFFYKKNIKQFALVSGSGGQNNLQTPSAHSSYHVWNTFSADRDGYTNTGNESLYEIIDRLDSYNLNNASWANNDTLFTGASIRNFTAGTNGYSATGSSAYPNPPTMKDFPDTPPFSHTFTNAGATGRNGPTLTQIQNAYSGSGVSVSMSSYQGIQLWTVPHTGDYEVVVAGARGGNSGNYLGGYGGRVKGTLYLSAGVVLAIIVGQAGADMPQNNWASGVGGGGGSYVINANFQAPVYAVAGGGGGCNGASYVSQGGGWGNGTGSSGNYYGGSLGAYGAGGGAGFMGGGSGYAQLGGLQPGSGALGGDSLSQHSGHPAYTADGGFGGGGANGWHAGGGGGGYQGGSATNYNVSGGAYGGTTIFVGTTSNNTYDYHTGTHGYVTITAVKFVAGVAVPTTTAIPDKFAIWGINQDSDNDTQILAAYSGTLAPGNGKSDRWRNNNPPYLYWSYWGNDWYSDTRQHTISVGRQSDPGISTKVTGGHMGSVYLIAYGPPAVFPFSHTFTNAGATGRNGPTLTQIQNAYSSTSWASDTSKLNMTTQGYQIWTVPKTASYKFTIRGARGGDTVSFSGVGKGGYARYVTGEISLTAGTKLILVVGQQGNYMNGNYGAEESAGGGGGTFVANENSGSHIPLLVAGGGGGGAADGGGGYGDPWGNHVRTDDYSTYQISTAYLNNGNGGGVYNSNFSGGGGGGWNSDGTTGPYTNAPYVYDGKGGQGWANGLVGGQGANYSQGFSTTAGLGGFGGGGGAWINSEQRPGAGGGYSGGEGASYEQLGNNTNSGGGAGGNYINSTYVTSGTYGAQETSAVQGSILIEEIVMPPALYSFTTHTFTNAGATSRTGPTLTQCRNTYSSASWTSNNSNFNMSTQGLQIWTVPATGTYEIEIAGAHGGSLTGTYSGNWGLGGDGGWCKGTLSLTSGTKLVLIVGQAGLGSTSGWEGYGGGGASWVLNESLATLHAVAGGGGGANGPVYGLWNNPTLSPSAGYDYFNGSVTYGGDGGNSQGSSSDTAGGGQGNYSNGGGAGFTSDGAGDRAGQSTQCGGSTPANGAIGGESAYQGTGGYQHGKGGFGGGGGNGWHSGGGGGGYAGGDGADLNCAACRPVGGGGGTTYSNLTGTTFGTHAAQMGYIKITKV